MSTPTNPKNQNPFGCFLWTVFVAFICLVATCSTSSRTEQEKAKEAYDQKKQQQDDDTDRAMMRVHEAMSEHQYEQEHGVTQYSSRDGGPIYPDGYPEDQKTVPQESSNNDDR